MLDSIHVAASGLNGHQKGLKTISGNVSNMNTPGFKGNNAQFTDVFLNEAGQQGQSGNLDAGGGMDLLKPTINFQTGEIRATGRDMDMALDGPGFFVVRNGQGEQLYTKSGRFEFDAAGKLVTMEDGFEVLGRAGGAQGAPTAVDLAGLRTRDMKATTQVSFTGNLSSTAGNVSTPGPDHTIDAVTVYDAAGTARTLKFEFTVKRVTDPSSAQVSLLSGTWGVRVLEGTTEVGAGELRTSGGMADPLADRFYLMLKAQSGQTTAVSVVLGAGVTGNSGGSTSTLAKDKVDGNAAGTVTKTSIDATGMVVVTYSNGLTSNGPKLAVAEFVTPDVLTRASGALFSYEGTDPVRFVELGKTTKLVSGSLELSNIDLTDQFSNMILIQRGFQASSQVLSTASEMIQSLYDLKSRR